MESELEWHYIGFELDDTDFINSSELREYLNSHPFLKVMKFDPEDSGESVVEVQLPVTNDEYTFIVDERVGYTPGVHVDDLPAVLYINHEDDAYAADPSEEFVDILFMMYKLKLAAGDELFYDDDEGDFFDHEDDRIKGLFGSRLDK